MFHFRNPGIIAIEAVTTLGVSVKEGENAIGRFGTGLKYTIAGVARLGGTITVHAGPNIYSFAGEEREVRGKSFQFITMRENGLPPVRLGFTSDLGKHWEPWMYARELWSNMRDERGTWDFGDTFCGDAETVIVVDCEPIETALREIHKFILPDTSVPLTKTDRVGEIHGGANPTFFYQGIRVAVSDRPTLFTYNFTGRMDLTEDRVALDWTVRQRALSTIRSCRNPAIIRQALTAKKGTFEAGLDWHYSAEDHPDLKAVLKDLWEKTPAKLTESAAFEAARIFKGAERNEFTLTKVQQSKWTKALEFCKALGFTADPEVKFVHLEDEKLYGFVEDGKIFLTRMAFDNGTAFLAQTYIEEYIHAVEGISDYGRAFQDYLLRKLVALGEELMGEAL